MNNDQLNSFQEKGFYILAQDKNFVSSIDDLPNWAFKEKHFIQKRNRIKDDWLNFITQNKQKIISMHHFIDECEFNYSDIKQRTKRIFQSTEQVTMKGRSKRNF